MIDKIIERMSDGAYKGINGTALLRLDMEEMRQQHTEMVDKIEDFEVQVEELKTPVEKIQLGKRIDTMHRINFWYEESGSTIVRASNVEEAEIILTKELDEHGVDRIEYKTTNRDFGSQGE